MFLHTNQKTWNFGPVGVRICLPTFNFHSSRKSSPPSTPHHEYAGPMPGVRNIWHVESKFSLQGGKKKHKNTTVFLFGTWYICISWTLNSFLYSFCFEGQNHLDFSKRMKYCWQADPGIHHLVEAVPEHKPHFWVVKTLQPQDTVSTAACHRSHSSAHHGFSEVWSISSSVWRAENLKIWHLFWGWGDVHVKLLPGMFTTKKLWEAMRRGLQHVTTLSSFHLFPKLQSTQTFRCCCRHMFSMDGSSNPHAASCFFHLAVVSARCHQRWMPSLRPTRPEINKEKRASKMSVPSV